MDHLLTEARNPASTNLDELSALELVRLMAGEDAAAPRAVAAQAETIARAIEEIAARLRRGGRLIYAGAGTSGRLGILDATECPPTFNSPLGQVIGIIAGGPKAITQAVEGAEDHPEYGEQDLRAISLRAEDVVVGIATSGRTPYVLGAAAYARTVGAYTIGLSCNPDSELSAQVDLPLTVAVGPEILSGSTRLKAGTATKLVLNMLSTGAMVRLGKTFGNLMVDLRATNDKLRARTNRIVRQLTGLSTEAADALLQSCDGELKTALVAHLAGLTPQHARARLASVGGQVRQALAGAQPAAPAHPDLVIGIDGGGSHTVALLARRDGPAGQGTVLGKGIAGPSNLQAVGIVAAAAALDQAVDGAFGAAGLSRGQVAAACLGLAGVARPDDRAVIERWAARVHLAGAVEVTNDATLLFAAGTPAGWGLALIAGTGSFALAQNSAGATARAGGWGYLLGDEGSGYALAMEALRAVARAADGRAPATALSARLLGHLGLAEPSELIREVYRQGMDRAALAALAPVVLDAAQAGDLVAHSIVGRGASQLAETGVVAARRLFGDRPRIPVALAGGVLASSPWYAERILQSLRDCDVTPDPVSLVVQPALGAVIKALRLVPD